MVRPVDVAQVRTWSAHHTRPTDSTAIGSGKSSLAISWLVRRRLTPSMRPISAIATTGGSPDSTM